MGTIMIDSKDNKRRASFSKVEDGMEWSRTSRSSVVSEYTPSEISQVTTPQRPVSGVPPQMQLPSPSGDRLAYKESIKVRKQTYKIQKKKANKEFSTAIKDKSVIILSSWLKIRGSLKSWAKYWCVVKPEVLMIYKSESLHHWIGTVLINNCEFIERPSSKEGFCFKILQPYGQSIWTARGPKGETAASLSQPMPKDYLILRAGNEEVGRCWLDALEVAQRSSLVTPNDKIQSDIYGGEGENKQDELDRVYHDGSTGDKSDFSSAEEANDEEEDDPLNTSVVAENIEETPYTTLVETEEFGEAGETTEEMEEESKSILWALLKQVRPGMDLSKVTLPTFILEPRSFLEKLADYYYHADILAHAAKQDNPYLRMKEVVKWYLSGFYKKPKGLKKPYNPIIGETFRCMWPNAANDSKTFYISEQVSHHPPVSAFYISNRKDGYVVGGSILAKSKFYGNSTSAILDGVATLSLLPLGEEYTMSMPYAHVKGILIGSLTAEMGGVINIKCEKTGYNAEIDFKLKPFWKKSGECNFFSGKIKMGNDVLSKVEGRWDGDTYITEYNKKTSNSNEEPLPEIFFTPSPEVKKSRLQRYNVDYECQETYESEKLWMEVSNAIRDANQTAATREKLVLEDEQRRVHKELVEKEEVWVPRHFELDPDSTNSHAWVYKYKDLRPWDPCTDVKQYEHQGVIKSQTKHRIPMVKRTSSAGNVSNAVSNAAHSSAAAKKMSSIKEPLYPDDVSRRTSFDRSSHGSAHTEADSNDCVRSGPGVAEEMERCMQPVTEQSKETQKQITLLRLELRRLAERMNNQERVFSHRDLLLVGVVLILQIIVTWFTRPPSSCS